MYKDLTGQKFGRLTVVKLNHKEQNYHKGKRNGNTYLWLCQCECGNTDIVSGGHLKDGSIQSCGCLQKDTMKKKLTIHNMANTNIYKAYHKMKDRCQNEKNSNFKNYGGRGIKVCDEWQTFETFYNWAITNGYKKGLSIDRINNNGNYEPSNCRWVTQKIQSNNRRNNVLITYKDETHTILEWSEILNINYDTLHKRIKYYGWSIEKAFNKKVRKRWVQKKI